MKDNEEIDNDDNELESNVDENGVDSSADIPDTIVDSFINAGEKRQQKFLEEIQQIDVRLKYGFTLILNYWAENGQFNQKLLEDIFPLIVKRSRVLKKIK
jgi:hypothetical protein